MHVVRVTTEQAFRQAAKTRNAKSHRGKRCRGEWPKCKGKGPTIPGSGFEHVASACSLESVVGLPGGESIV